MAYTKVIYKDELDSFLGNFRELVVNGKIEMADKKEMLLFLEFFNQHLTEAVLPISVYDLRASGKAYKI